jgi:hypothetical protein
MQHNSLKSFVWNADKPSFLHGMFRQEPLQSSDVG